MEIELKDPKPPSLNGFHSPAIRIPGGATPTKSRASNYTSLKDILHSSSPSSSTSQAVAATPSTPASAAAFPPTPTTSWQEIPIRNPLVKHAAMAYLQPMSTPTASFRGKGFAARLIERCFGGGGGAGEEFGCLAWLCDAVARAAREALAGLCGDRRSGEGFDDDSDDVEDDDDEKVD